ncbi:AbiTii domain-containing protein [Rugamonas rivuli]|uniref:Response regulator receiver protein n=1 Tax=Rugamonas rivuli TaxID=2743358 RepID=A0A843SKT6_9BURK|nr:response regulator receiver protein [Rugamonas rivuli]MQA22793.1 response regulator receiver protein [Rugamonas rivuli]
MKLLDDIVDLLMREDGSLQEALLRTKVLLHKIGQQTLVDWVSSELTGYARTDQLPDYRCVRGRVYGNISDGYNVYKRTLIPIMHLSEQQRDYLEGDGMRQALGVMEKLLATATSTSSLAIPIAPEFNQSMAGSLATGCYVEQAWAQTEMSQVRQVLIEVRSRLLDFILTLQGEIGATVSVEDAKQATAGMDVQGMFTGAVLKGNVTVLVGNHNHQSVQITTTKGDMAALVAELKRHNVTDEDTDALTAAIRNDPTPTVAGQYGPATQGWMKSMMNKAIEASWNIELGIAGGLLTSALQRYYNL